jgi:hypothetical protein
MIMLRVFYTMSARPHLDYITSVCSNNIGCMWQSYLRMDRCYILVSRESRPPQQSLFRKKLSFLPRNEVVLVAPPVRYMCPCLQA